MSETIRMSIPLDDDGFADLECIDCGERFRLRPEDYERDEYPCIYCPACGSPQDVNLSSESLSFVRNQAAAFVERRMAAKLRSFGIVSARESQFDKSSAWGVASLDKHHFDCCGNHGKIGLATIVGGPYCPFCGERTMKNNTIKKTSREFRVQASQLARADFRIYGEQMSAFLEYIENTPCLIDYIRSCGPANRDWEKELSKGFDHWSECGISFSPNPKTRTAEVYSLLRHLVDSHVDFVSFGMRYNLDGDCSETIRSFHRAIPQILVDNLNLRLEELEDEADSIEGNMPTISIGTASNVNIAQNHSSISTSSGAEFQSNRELMERLDELSSMLSELTTTQQTEANDCIQEAKSSIMAGTTWSKVKRTFQAMLGCVNGSGKLAKSVLDLISLAQTVLPQ